ncbi:MAG: chloramphenicol acetyltransferase [Desulfobacterota bacterium]|nr:chloramphenicol acetyltransferase [Thermodesulfobacteriota bacterium]
MRWAPVSFLTEEPGLFGGKTGDPVIEPSAKVLRSCLGKWTYVGERTRMEETEFGDYSYVMEDCQIIYAEIGKFCSIASNTRINPPNHPTWRATTHHFTYRSRFYEFGEDDEAIFQWRRENRVTIGHDVWIGHGVTILPGLRIGTGAVVGAGSVVTKEVAPYTIVAGNPAKLIRRRVAEDVEASLMRIAWWNWSHEKLKGCLKDFRELDAPLFCEKYDPLFRKA